MYVCKILIITLLLSCHSLNAQEGQTVRFELEHGLIFFKLTSEKEPLVALFDTGAEASAIDIQTSERMALPVIDSSFVTGTDTTIQVPVVKLEDLRLQDHVKTIEPTRRDLSHSLSPPGKQLDLILGNDFFANSVVAINFPKQQLQVCQKIEPQKYDFWIPFILDHNIPRFSATVNDSLQFDFRLDTGASLFETEKVYLNITTHDLFLLKKKFRDLEPQSYLSATGIDNKAFRLPVFKLKNLKVGATEFEQAFAIVQPERGYFASPEAVGFLSNNFLSKFEQVAIDYINCRIYFKSK